MQGDPRYLACSVETRSEIVVPLRVLGAAGFAVTVPERAVCCGLTWMTTGQLDTARRVLRGTLSAPELGGEEPIVVLEPSCAASGI